MISGQFQSLDSVTATAMPTATSTAIEPLGRRHTHRCRPWMLGLSNLCLRWWAFRDPERSRGHREFRACGHGLQQRESVMLPLALRGSESEHVPTWLPMEMKLSQTPSQQF